VAFKYLYMIAVPLLIAYAVYSLVYDTHKSWYSFIITTLVGSVYAYGFLMMVPSLYINYRLKSVAHMPAKAMTYKFLNTFIDDLFAFTIKMPMLHRLATLRDDVIFFVYLYQSYKYKVDYTRVNEFGQGGEDDVTTKVDMKEDDVKDIVIKGDDAKDIVIKGDDVKNIVIKGDDVKDIDIKKDDVKDIDIKMDDVDIKREYAFTEEDFMARGEEFITREEEFITREEEVVVTTEETVEWSSTTTSVATTESSQQGSVTKRK